MLTAGPTPLPPAVSQVMARADPLPPRAGIRRDLRAGARAAAEGLPDRERRSLLRRDRDRAPWSPPSPTWSAPGEPAVVASCGKFGERWAELCDAFGADTEHVEFEWGRRSIPARARRGAGRARRRRRGPSSSTQSETSTGVAQRHPGAQRGRARPRLRPLRGRGLGPRRRRAAPGRMGRGRRRRRLAEVADVPAGPRLRVGLRSRDGARGREPGGRYYLDWKRTATGQRKEPPNSRVHARP